MCRNQVNTSTFKDRCKRLAYLSPTATGQCREYAQYSCIIALCKLLHLVVRGVRHKNEAFDGSVSRNNRVMLGESIAVEAFEKHVREKTQCYSQATIHVEFRIV